MSVAAAVLAAGGSRRLGRPKQLLRTAAGESLVAHAVDAALGSRARPVAVVVGHAEGAVRAALGDRPVEFVRNPEWNEGMASSIRAAAAWVAGHAGKTLEGIVLLACDQPAVTSELLDRLLDAAGTGEARRAACRYAGRPGVPALFGRRWLPALADLRGDRGARSVLEAPGPLPGLIDWPEGEIDIDRPEDLGRLGPARGGPPAGGL